MLKAAHGDVLLWSGSWREKVFEGQISHISGFWIQKLPLGGCKCKMVKVSTLKKVCEVLNQNGSVS